MQKVGAVLLLCLVCVTITSSEMSSRTSLETTQELPPRVPELVSTDCVPEVTPQRAVDTQCCAKTHARLYEAIQELRNRLENVERQEQKNGEALQIVKCEGGDHDELRQRIEQISYRLECEHQKIKALKKRINSRKPSKPKSGSKVSSHEASTSVMPAYAIASPTQPEGLWPSSST